MNWLKYWLKCWVIDAVNRLCDLTCHNQVCMMYEADDCRKYRLLGWLMHEEGDD